MTIAAVRPNLRTALLAVTGFPTTQVAWENRPFTPTIGTLWVRETLKPVDAVIAATGGNGVSLLESFLYLIDVFAPAMEGTATAETLAENIRSAFKPGTGFSAGGSEYAQVEQADRGAMLGEPNWSMLPITIRLRLYRQNT